VSRLSVAAAGEITIILPDVGPFVLREEQREHLPAELREKAGGSFRLRRIGGDREAVRSLVPEGQE